MQDQLGNLEEAERHFNEAFEITEGQLEKDPENPDRIFEHAQSVYWVGYLNYAQGDYIGAIAKNEQYLELAKALADCEPNSFRSQQEEIFALSNIAIINAISGRENLAKQAFEKLIPKYISASENYPENIDFKLDLADAYGWLADSYLNENPAQSVIYRRSQVLVFEEMSANYPTGKNVTHRGSSSLIGLAHANYKLANYSEAKRLIDEVSPQLTDLIEYEPNNSEWMSTCLLYTSPSPRD